MKAVVDQETCIGCGLCPSMSPEVFQMNDDGKAEAIVDEVSGELVDSAKEAEESCPVNAILVE
jgi:ferredoxin